ncbi:30S ribosomal protein S16 [Boudabousia marimammalium]|uniref:Small ribosomal subunit protein bS16 n=1 Tax=Boudabousia marimammalium TaxID=156892 RepID=A0A1Q5PRJ4_9ACTO|nr:30S ribosomal protein S16 [Boudabousia marimammalium]OKL50133.1 30S ribosomal protein S16 [Boudabousia marimammalium]
MAVRIRLKRMGKIRAPFYRIVVVDSRKKRDGRVIEQVGKYDPMTTPSLIDIDSERVQYWLSVGAQPSDAVKHMLDLTGDWAKFKGAKNTESRLEYRDEAAKQAAAAKAMEEAAKDAEKLKAALAEEKAKAEAEKAAAEKAVAEEAAAEPVAEEAAEEPAEAPAEEA